MGLDVYSKLVAGVRLRYAKVKREKTRYDQDTGVPTIVSVFEGEWRAGDAVIDIDGLRNADKADKLVHYADLEDHRSYVFGLAVDLNDSHRIRDRQIVDLPPGAEQLELVAKASVELGRFGYAGPISLLVVQISSY